MSPGSNEEGDQCSFGIQNGDVCGVEDDLMEDPDVQFTEGCDPLGPPDCPAGDDPLVDESQEDLELGPTGCGAFEQSDTDNTEEEKSDGNDSDTDDEPELEPCADVVIDESEQETPACLEDLDGCVNVAGDHETVEVCCDDEGMEIECPDLEQQLPPDGCDGPDVVIDDLNPDDWDNDGEDDDVDIDDDNDGIADIIDDEPFGPVEGVRPCRKRCAPCVAPDIAVCRQKREGVASGVCPPEGGCLEGYEPVCEKVEEVEPDRKPCNESWDAYVIPSVDLLEDATIDEQTEFWIYFHVWFGWENMNEDVYRGLPLDKKTQWFRDLKDGKIQELLTPCGSSAGPTDSFGYPLADTDPDPEEKDDCAKDWESYAPPQTHFTYFDLPILDRDLFWRYVKVYYGEIFNEEAYNKFTTTEQDSWWGDFRDEVGKFDEPCTEPEDQSPTTGLEPPPVIPVCNECKDDQVVDCVPSEDAAGVGLACVPEGTASCADGLVPICVDKSTAEPDTPTPGLPGPGENPNPGPGENPNPDPPEKKTSSEELKDVIDEYRKDPNDTADAKGGCKDKAGNVVDIDIPDTDLRELITNEALSNAAQHLADYNGINNVTSHEQGAFNGMPAFVNDPRCDFSNPASGRYCNAHAQRAQHFGYNSTYVVENVTPIMEGEGPEDAFKRWLCSSDHNRNMLDDKVTDIGVGWKDGADGKPGHVVIVLGKMPAGCGRTGGESCSLQPEIPPEGGTSDIPPPVNEGGPGGGPGVKGVTPEGRPINPDIPCTFGDGIVHCVVDTIDGPVYDPDGPIPDLQGKDAPVGLTDNGHPIDPSKVCLDQGYGPHCVVDTIDGPVYDPDGPIPNLRGQPISEEPEPEETCQEKVGYNSKDVWEGKMQRDAASERGDMIQFVTDYNEGNLAERAFLRTQRGQKWGCDGTNVKDLETGEIIVDPSNPGPQWKTTRTRACQNLDDDVCVWSEYDGQCDDNIQCAFPWANIAPLRPNSQPPCRDEGHENVNPNL